MRKNPFLDLGFPPEEAAALHIRSQLAATFELHIQRKGWTQVAAARELNVPSIGRCVTDASHSEVRQREHLITISVDR